MACNEQEAGKHKCERYWSDQEDDEEEVQFGKYFVRLLKSREICPDFLVRTMRLRWTGEGIKIKLTLISRNIEIFFHFTEFLLYFLQRRKQIRRRKNGLSVSLRSLAGSRNPYSSETTSGNGSAYSGLPSFRDTSGVGALFRRMWTNWNYLCYRFHLGSLKDGKTNQ